MSKEPIHTIIKLVVTIVDRGKGQQIAEISKKEHLHFHILCFGLGTADSKIQDYLGIGTTEKDIVITMMPEFKIPPLLSAISQAMHLKKPGKGITFTMPIISISSLLSQLLIQEEHIEMESEVKKMGVSSKYALVLVIANRGYTDKVMAAAKSAGARGGTVIDARGIGYEEAEKFLGISIQAEKSIVCILCKREDKKGIMQNISQAAGLKTTARGIVLSLPVDDMIGLNQMDGGSISL